MADKLKDSFGIVADVELIKAENVNEDKKELVIVETEESKHILSTEGFTDSRKIEYDYDISRKTLYDVLDKNEKLTNHAISVALSSDHPKAFEVAGNLLKQHSIFGKDLLKIHKERKEIDFGGFDETKPKGVTNLTQNNFEGATFTGTTSEIMEKLNNNPTKEGDPPNGNT